MRTEANKRTATQISKNEQIRRSAKTRKQKKRNTEVKIAVGVIVFLLILAIGLATFLLKVGYVSVADNVGRYTDERIIEVAGISESTGFLTINEEKIENTVCVALPYIKSLQIKRSFPDSVELLVEYEQQMFSVDCGQIWLVLGESGKVLETAQAKPYGVTELTGVQVTEYTVGKTAVFESELLFTHAVDVHKAFSEAKITDMKLLRVENSGTVSVNIGNRFYIQSGSHHILIEKMQVLKTVLDERKEKNQCYTFTVAADGSITISNREGPIEEDVIPNDPWVNMDSELVGGTSGELVDSRELVDSQTQNTTQTQQTTQSSDGALG